MSALIRFFDIVIALMGLILMAPFLLAIALWIKYSSKGNVLYRQSRVGKNNADFILYKFRTMFTDADKMSALTIGHSDARITKAGYFLRKYKLDELPQFFNVLKGDMSIVGPRPELRKYVDLYAAEQKKVLSVKPGITDEASICFSNESELLALQQQPEDYYIKEIMPVKIQLNMHYIENKNPGIYFIIIFKIF